VPERLLDGKVAIVTGAGSPIGLGRAMAIALVGAGARVMLLDVNEEQLSGTLADVRPLGGDPRCALASVGDVSRPGDAHERWDESLPLQERLANASAPAAWQALGRQGIHAG
jgi:NAD(P)-dependent dehydrogenase (short-subunit alcohol dehydrogenase family)